MTDGVLSLSVLVAVVMFAALAIWREMHRRHRARLQADFTHRSTVTDTSTRHADAKSSGSLDILADKSPPG